MITTRFLATYEYSQYATWLKGQDNETKHLYFGFMQSDENIDRLIKNLKHPDNFFLVAEHKGQWSGTVHIAVSAIDEVEFGVIVSSNFRGRGVADRMLSEAIIWSRNRGYATLYMHCLTWNQPIKRLCTKHGLMVNSSLGESETKMPLPPADITSVTKEIATRNKNIYRMLLQSTVPFIGEIYG